MAAAKALLTAAGMLKPKIGNVPWRNTSSSRICIATEHAKPCMTNTATEHVTSSKNESPTGSGDDPSYIEHVTSSKNGSPTGPGDDPSYIEPEEAGLLLGDTDLEKIAALLMWMSKDFQRGMHQKVIYHEALCTLLKFSDTPTGDDVTFNQLNMGLMHTSSVVKLSQTIDIMMLPNPKAADQTPKDANDTLAFMRRVASFRDGMIRDTINHNATERVELDPDDVSKCYKRFGRNLITYDLLPHQKQDDRYILRTSFVGDIQLTGKQRSFVDNMLRKALGDKKVAMRIWQYGLPIIADLPIRGRLDICLLQSSMEECTRWYLALANDISNHQTQAGFDGQRSASSLNRKEQEQQRIRRESLRVARDAMRLGATLAKQRDSNKRSYYDMNDTEQQTLQDFDTGKTKKAKLSHTTLRMQPFRSSGG